MTTPQGEEALLPTYAVLTSANKHIAIVCAQENFDYMACKGKDANPAACLEQGKKVTKCVANLLADINSRCKADFKDYFECMDYYSCRFKKCRKEQKAFEATCEIKP